jgi:hypothetical protein
MSFTKAILLVLGATGLAMADTCALSAYNTAVASLNLGTWGGGSTATSTGSGFALSINGGTPIALKADTGNNFPILYACPGDKYAGSGYGYARFSNTPKGNLGICLTNIHDIVPGSKFDCENLGGQVFKGTTSSKFYGIATSVGSYCEVTWDC